MYFCYCTVSILLIETKQRSPLGLNLLLLNLEMTDCRVLQVSLSFFEMRSVTSLFSLKLNVDCDYVGGEDLFIYAYSKINRLNQHTLLTIKDFCYRIGL